jgi:hypothetical protein
MDTDRLMFFLSQEGFRPTRTVGGEVQFNYEGGHYYIRQAPDDDQYLAVIYPKFWEIRSPEEAVRALRAANEAGQWTKVAKIHVFENQHNVWAEAELLIAQPEHFEAIFARSLAIIQAGVTKFIDLMKRSEPLPDKRIELAREDITRLTHGN